MTSPSKMEHIKHLCGYSDFFLNCMLCSFTAKFFKHSCTYYSNNNITWEFPAAAAVYLGCVLSRICSRAVVKGQENIFDLNIYKIDSKDVFMSSIFVHRIKKAIEGNTFYLIST